MGEEERSVEGGFEAFSFAGGLDHDEKVLVGFELLARQSRFEHVIVGRGTVPTVRNERGFAEIP